MELLSRQARVIVALVIDGFAIGYPLMFALVRHHWRARGRVYARQLAPCQAAPNAAAVTTPAPRRVPATAWRAPSLIEIWAEGAWWQALVNSRQLERPQWVPADLLARAAAARVQLEAIA